MTTKSEIVEHYASHNLIEKIENALKETYGDITKLDWDQISAFDQFHIRGLSATKELADRLKLTSEAHVLDIGCGLGGPARYLASTYGCNVTGIDLTPEYVETANWLTNLTDLSDKVNCQIADATTLPFDNLRFDFVWTQHVAMNISDKSRLYDEIYRVLNPGGTLAIYDITKGDNEPNLFPVPWAADQSASFVIPSSLMIEL